MLSVPGEPALLPLYSSRHRALPWGSSRDGKSSEHYADVPRFLPYTEGPLPPETVVSRHFDSELISCTLNSFRVRSINLLKCDVALSASPRITRLHHGYI